MSDSEERELLDKTERHFKRYRRFERSPLKASDVLSRLIARRGFTQEQFNDELQTAWQQVIGNPFTGKTQATTIKRGVLEVLVESSPALQQLAFSKTALLKKIQTELPDAGIKSLRFKVGTLLK